MDQLFYHDCVPNVAEVIDVVDKEGRLICEGVDLVYESLLQISNERYGTDFKPFAEFVKGVLGYRTVKAPKGPLKEHRYAHEDMECNAVMWKTLALRLGLDTPMLNHIIESGARILGRDVMMTGWNAAFFGVHCSGLPALINIFL